MCITFLPYTCKSLSAVLYCLSFERTLSACKTIPLLFLYVSPNSLVVFRSKQRLYGLFYIPTEHALARSTDVAVLNSQRITFLLVKC